MPPVPGLLTRVSEVPTAWLVDTRPLSAGQHYSSQSEIELDAGVQFTRQILHGLYCSSVYICLEYVNLSRRGKRKQVPEISSIADIATSAVISDFFLCCCSQITHATV